VGDRASVELHLDGVTVSGRADVILDQEAGVPTALAIVDYKASTTGDPLEHALQLSVYADAGRREGLDVRAAYVHDMRSIERHTVAVDESAVASAEVAVSAAAARIRARAAGAVRCGRSAGSPPVERFEILPALVILLV